MRQRDCNFFLELELLLVIVQKVLNNHPEFDNLDKKSKSACIKQIVSYFLNFMFRFFNRISTEINFVSITWY